MNRRIKAVAVSITVVVGMSVAGLTAIAHAGVIPAQQASPQADGGDYQLTVRNNGVYVAQFQAAWRDAGGGEHHAASGKLYNGQQKPFTLPLGNAEENSFAWVYAYLGADLQWHEIDREDTYHLPGPPWVPQPGASYCVEMTGVAGAAGVDTYTC